MIRGLILVVFLVNLSCFSQDYKDFELKYRADSLNSYLMAKNNLPTSITFKIKNKKTDSIVEKHIINSLDSLKFMVWDKMDREEYIEKYDQSFSVNYSLGDSISTNPDKDFLYQLPIQKNKKYKIIQSWGGSFSHNSATSYHAIDFKMAIGEPVHASRAGIVVRSVENFTENGGRELRSKANVIVIMHDDKTFAYYVHLKHEGSLVEIGQKIELGQLIGYSGNVGISTQPHLHFVVRDGTGKSIPISFKNQDKSKPLIQGKKYRRK